MNPRTFDILRLRAEGKTLREIGAVCGITKQRVSQIIRDARLHEQRERCARGEHGSNVTERQHTVWIWGQGPTVVRSAVCNDCGAEVER